MLESHRRERLRSPEQRVGALTNGALPPPMNDEELLESALVDGDDRALEEAVARLSPAMIRVAMTHVRSRADAEDVVQEAWIGALRSVARFERRSSLKTWLFRILKNRARTQGVRLARFVTFTDLSAAMPPDHNGPLPGVDFGVDPYALAAPEREVLARELGERISRAIAGLPRRQRLVVTLRDVDGRSAGEVTDRLGISDGNQRVLLHRGRARIRDQLADEDGARKESLKWRNRGGRDGLLRPLLLLTLLHLRSRSAWSA